tara:strand:- start:861 stop:1934 length:1074 start_codon:yes stop_codon:yes gene_type:complete
MGYKNHAQRKAVHAHRADGGKGHPDKKGSPNKNIKRKTLLGAEVELKDGDKAIRFMDPRKLKANYEQIFKPAVKKHLQRPKNLVKNIYEGGKEIITESVDFLKDQKKLTKSGSPMNHCASDMMHSGGWQEMRKHNSPGTIGNKAGIKHNEKMRQEIGTFKMPHQSSLSPLSNTEQDSIAASKAWKKEKELYLKKPDGEKEYNMEKGEKYYDVDKNKLRLIPTDDADKKDLTGIKKWQLAPERKSSMSPLNVDPFAKKKPVEKKDEKLKTSVLYGTTMKERKSHYEADKPGSNYFMRKKEKKEKNKSTLSPLNKEGKKDACYHKVKKAVKVWPSAYASGQLVQCRKRGASNWGVGKKK